MNNRLKYRFYDTDSTGNAEYDISGNDYFKLIDVCCKYCSVVSFKIGNKSSECLEYLNPFLVKKDIKVNTGNKNQRDEIRFYSVCDEMCKFLKEVSSSIFSWLYYIINLEDLTFYREDGSVFFESSTHDGICDLIPKEDEDISEIISKGDWVENPKPIIFDFSEPTKKFEEIIKERNERNSSLRSDET